MQLTPEDLIGTYVTDRRGLEIYVGDASPVTDDRPRIEYASWVRPGEVVRVLFKLFELRMPPPVVAMPDERARIEDSFRPLGEVYAVSVLALAGDRENWAAAVEIASRTVGPNPYFDWILDR